MLPSNAVAGGLKVLCSRAAITGYWLQRFAEKPAGELKELQPNGDGVVVSYGVPDGLVRATLVRATLYFDCDGKIARSVCGPTAEVMTSL
jgi:hypothetical protein